MFAQRVQEAVQDFYTILGGRRRSYWLHVPSRYYQPDMDGSELKTLQGELERAGAIALDANGEPCCLSGQPPLD